jgi:hypothetical protein
MVKRLKFLRDWLHSITNYIFILLMSVCTGQCLVLMFFWVKSPCGLVGRSQRFREACCLHLQGCSLQPSSSLKKEKSCFSKMLACTNLSTQQLNSKEYHQNCHHCRKLASSKQYLVFIQFCFDHIFEICCPIFRWLSPYYITTLLCS